MIKLYLYGKNVVKELIENNKTIQKAYVYKNFSDKNLILELKKRNININYLEKNQLDKLVKGLHQGIIVSVANYKYADIDTFINDDNSLVVILDHLEDPHNFGAIIRTCEAAGVDGIIIPKDRSVSVNSTVMKTSSGAAVNIKICMVTNLVQTINYLKEKGYWIYVSSMDGTSYTSEDYKTSTCIIIGNEGKGVSELVRKSADFIVSIPMIGKINSLNASVAAGIFIYEVVRPRSN